MITGMHIYTEEFNHITEHYLLDEFQQLKRVVDVVVCKDNDEERPILESWQKWFTQHNSPWVTVRKLGVCTIWKAVEKDRELDIPSIRWGKNRVQAQ